MGYERRGGGASSGTSTSNATPQPVGTAAAGTGTLASRDDHVHSDALSTVGFKTGLYYPPIIGNALSGQTQALNRAYATPLIVYKAATFDRINSPVWTATATALLRLGIYADTGTRYPGSLILDAGQLDVSSASPGELTISQALAPGLYWLVAASQGSAASKQYAFNTSNGVPGMVAFANAVSYSGSSPTGFFADSVSGALPSTWTSTVNTVGTNGAPGVFLRAA